MNRVELILLDIVLWVLVILTAFFIVQIYLGVTEMLKEKRKKNGSDRRQ